MRPSRVTDEVFRLLSEQVQIRDRAMSLKKLSIATGFSPSHCRELMERIRNGVIVKIIVSRETVSRDTRGS